MKHLSLFILVLSLSSCQFINSGIVDNWTNKESITAVDNIQIDTLQLPPFSRINSSVSLNFIYSDGPQMVISELPENVIDHISFDVVDGELKIRTKGVNLRNMRKATLKLSLPELRGIKISGFSDFLAEDGLKSSHLDIDISGSGDIVLKDANLGGLDVNISGSGDIFADRLKCGDISTRISGSGDIKMENIECEDVFVKIMGSGDVSLAGRSKDVDVRINGSGDIDLKNLVNEGITSSISGSGRICTK